MRHATTLGLLCVLVASGGCVSTRTTQIAADRATAWRGKTVALTARPRAAFMAMTAGKAAFALIGAIAMEEAGKTIVTANGIEDPAPGLAQALLKSAEERYGVAPAAIAPVSVDTTDVVKLAQAGKGADLLFDAQSMGSSFRYLPTDWSHYVVDSLFKVRIIDVASASLIAEGFCRRTTQDEKVHPTRDELLADEAARLKQILKSQLDSCATELKEKVLGIGA